MIFQTITTPHPGSIPELDSTITNNVDLHSSTMLENRFPAVRFVEGALNGDVTCWFVPNVQAVAAMLRACGFKLGQQLTFTNDHDIIVRCST
jgi:hypothetical protein